MCTFPLLSSLLMYRSIPPLLIALTTSLAAQVPARYSRVSIALTGPPRDLAGLAALGLPIDHAEHNGRSCTVEINEADIELVRANGYQVDVLVDDVARWYRERNQGAAPTDERALGWLCDGPTTFTVPLNFNTGSMGGFLTWDEMQTELDDMAALYPGLISAKAPIGLSVEGRPIHFVRISNDPDTDQDKPEVLYTALHHAREPVSMQQLIHYMWWLLENYGTDPQATYLVDNRELYFVPCLNPDGYVYNQITNPDGGGMWRKNRKVNENGSFGVDLNRNYGHEWGLDDEGSSPNPNSETYRGTAAFSEPETQAVRAFCNAHEFRAALNYHAWGDMIIHPWATQQELLTPDSAAFYAHAARITRNNGHSTGTCFQVLNYLTNGSSDDWMYGEQDEKPKILAMTPELGDVDDYFWPPGWRIVPICQNNMDQNLLEAHLVGAYAAATDRSYPVLEHAEEQTPFDVQRLGMDPATFTVALEPLENVASVGAPRSFSDLDFLEVRRDSITLSPVPGLDAGDRIRFIIAVDNGLYTHRDTVERWFGTPVIAFSESGDNIAAWSGGWGVSTNVWHSSPGSITDSPFGPYVPESMNGTTLDDPIDLGSATSATLRFWARWDVNRIYDRVQVSASADGNGWTPLCGALTKPGSWYQNIDEPVYEGRQTEWVQEEMSLNGFIGGDVWLRFGINSNSETGRDGFWFDDLEVITTTDIISSVDAVANGASRPVCWPSPTSDRASVRLNTPVPSGAHVRLYDATGTVVLDQPFARGCAELDVRHLPTGVYACVISTPEVALRATRLVVAR